MWGHYSTKWRPCNTVRCWKLKAKSGKLGLMISHLRGTLISSGVDYVIIDCGGVGYLVHTPRETATALELRSKDEKEVSVFTHLAVRDTSLDLYGFTAEDELNFFELLISVSGIGPRSALQIMNLETVGMLSSAIIESNTAYLTKVSGIGKKSAERIIIELRDKIVAREEESGHAHSEDADAFEALTSLGYSAKEARDALRALPKGTEGAGNRLTEALKMLGK